MTSRFVRLKCLVDPAKTPDSIDVDVSGLNVGDAIHVSDLKIEGGEIHGEPETVVAHDRHAQEVELEPQVEAGAEPAVEGTETPAEGGESEGGE